MNVAYEEFVDFLAAGTTPQSLIDFRPSEATRTKVADLIHRQKTSGLSAEETSELNCYLQLEHIMRLAKRERGNGFRQIRFMSITYVNVEMRRRVEARAEGLCEYCLIAEADTCLGIQVDHIISEKH